MLEVTQFPNVKHDDQVDALAYTIYEFRQLCAFMYGHPKP
ncbi:hypothetical protein RB2083_2831 [Rhodobacteraceae bacterium HTCC2083]|jgi:phage terminase large subunit-like protein|nr:hypothetical protein RB2083_2831 [Rhodobacteraceae bacterium HTCC2083]